MELYNTAYSTKLWETLNEKIFEGKEPEEKSKIDRWGRIGRYAHFGGFLSLGAAIAPVIYETATDLPTIIGGAFMGVLGLCVYHNWIQGYNALYKAGADFINGERRFKPE